MNCKPGDLAVVVVSPSGVNLGRFVTCIRLASPEELKSANWVDKPTWVIDVALPTKHGMLRRLVCDSALRQIRDNGGEDETLTWAGKPKCAPA